MRVLLNSLLILCLILRLGIAIAPMFLHRALSVNLKCRILTGASQNMVMTAAIQGNFTDDPVLKQHCVCLLRSLGYMDAAGRLQIDAIQGDLPELIPDQNKVELMMSVCMNQKEDLKETAFHAMKCVSDLR